MILRREDLDREIVKVLLERKHRQQYEGSPTDPLEELPDEDFDWLWEGEKVS